MTSDLMLFAPWVLEIVIVSIAIIGIVLVVRDKQLSTGAKALWIVAMLLFGILAILCFIFWKRRAK